MLARAGNTLVVGDYSATIDAMGLQHAVVDVSGVEITTVVPNPNTPYTTGHINVFPLPHDPDLNRSGAIPGETLPSMDRLTVAAIVCSRP